MPGIVIKPRSRIFHGHEWVYASEVKKAFGDPQPGDVISLKDYKDRPMGTAIYNPQSQIVARRFSRRKQQLDAEFFARRITRALELRTRLEGIDPELCRLVWSESDGLPGVVIDRYGEHLVLQTLTLAMNQRVEAIGEALREVLSPTSITLRNESPVRAAEGMSPEKRMLHGDAPAPFRIECPSKSTRSVARRPGSTSTNSTTTRASPGSPQGAACSTASPTRAASPCTRPLRAPAL